MGQGIEPIVYYNKELTEKLIACAIEVHRHLGPGLLESAYEECYCHEAQLLTYLKLSGMQVGLIINFHSPTIKDGIKRLVL